MNIAYLVQSTRHFQHLRVIRELLNASKCLKFDATAVDDQDALNNLTSIGNSGVKVIRSDTSSGTPSNAHKYNIYFGGTQFLGDMHELLVSYCSLGLPNEINSNNSYVNIHTVIYGGQVEHQQISLAIDSGTTSRIPAYKITIADLSMNSIESPCISWGARSLGLSNLLKRKFARSKFMIVPHSMISLGNNIYSINASEFVEGQVSIGDNFYIGDYCTGNLTSLIPGGKSFVYETQEKCEIKVNDTIDFYHDTSVIEVFSKNSNSISKITTISISSDGFVSRNENIFKLKIDFMGITKITGCFPYGISANDLQNKLDLMFDYDRNGQIDENDSGHISVSRTGDGERMWGFGFDYKFESKGSSTMIGTSSVLGSNAPIITLLGTGSEIGCEDPGGEVTWLTSLATATNYSEIINFDNVMPDSIRAGSRIRIEGSYDAGKIYVVSRVEVMELSIILSEPFVGNSSTLSAILSLVVGSIPTINTKETRVGSNEYEYDVYFIGSYWENVPAIKVSRFGDERCLANDSDINGGMNRDIHVSTIKDGGGLLSSEIFALNRLVTDSGVESIFWVPPLFRISEDTSEVKRIISKDIEHTEIWGSGIPSFRLSYEENQSKCIDYNTTEDMLEMAFFSLFDLCKDGSICVSVTKSSNPILAPNGYVFSIYFNSEILKDKNLSKLSIDSIGSGCTPFSSNDGEVILIETVSQGRYSEEIKAGGFKLGSVDKHAFYTRWMGTDSSAMYAGKLF